MRILIFIMILLFSIQSFGLSTSSVKFEHLLKEGYCSSKKFDQISQQNYQAKKNFLKLQKVYKGLLLPARDTIVEAILSADNDLSESGKFKRLSELKRCKYYQDRYHSLSQEVFRKMFLHKLKFTENSPDKPSKNTKKKTKKEI